MEVCRVCGAYIPRDYDRCVTCGSIFCVLLDEDALGGGECGGSRDCGAEDETGNAD